MNTKLFVLLSAYMMTLRVPATMYYVNGSNPLPAPPYTTWTTAATNIQDAVNLTTNGDTVLVTNGFYAFGGLAITGGPTNRVALTNPITVQSVNGPWVTTIYGAGAANGPSAVRCAWLTNGAALMGFTLSGGATFTTGSTTALESGGGVWCASTSSTVSDCVIRSNISYAFGGGVFQGTMTSCLIVSNAGATLGNGASYESVLNNCTVLNNRGGAVGNPVAMTNCIIYNNPNGNCFGNLGTAYSHCCTTPALAGTGNFTNAPQLFVDGVHLSQGSPCIGTGVNIGAGADIFGMVWSNPPSVGCAEWQPSPALGAPQLSLSSCPVGFSIGNMTLNGSSPLTFAWFQNGSPLENNGHFSFTQSSNLVATGILLSDAGNYQLVVSNAFGVVTSQVVQVVIHAVNGSGVNPVAPYTTWATAATDIQDAVNTASTGDIVLVTNGLYSSGGTVVSGGLTNRVVVNKAIIVTSVNGYAATAIQGAWDPSLTGPDAVRCAYLGSGAILNGFALQNGATLATGDGGFAGGPLESGGGVYCTSSNAFVSNCLLSNNAAIYGGGIINGTLYNSLVFGNQATWGGGAYDTLLNNCTVANNFIAFPYSFQGAGIYGSYVYSVNNSIVVDNYDYVSESSDNYDYPGPGPTFSYSCTSPMPGGNSNNNIVANPQLLDSYHIAVSSPCRGAGSSLYASGTDLDGEAWLSPPSMGCDEVVVSNLVGALSPSLVAYSTNLVVNGSAFFWGYYSGRAAAVSWSFGDGTGLSNAAPNVGHIWTNIGNYPVAFTVYNNTYPNGVSVVTNVQVQPLLAPQLQPNGIVAGAFQFQFPGQNANYTIQYTTNLAAPASWHTLQMIFLNPQGIIQINDPATNGTRFYRVLAQ